MAFLGAVNEDKFAKYMNCCVPKSIACKVHVLAGRAVSLLGAIILVMRFRPSIQAT